MQKPRFLILLALTLISLQAAAEVLTMRAHSYFLRSNPDFGSDRSNVVGVLTRGSTFEVLERRARPDGSEALRIRVINRGRSSNVNPSTNYWVYKSNDRDFSGGSAPARDTTGSTCTNCDRSGGAPIPRGTRDDIAAISREATRGGEQPAEDAARRPVPRGSPTREQIRRYASSSNVDRMIRFADRNYGHNRRGGGRCYRKVKDSMAAGGLIPSWYDDLAAKNAVHTLQRAPRRYINLLDHEPYRSEITSPSQAPRGAILVYENVPRSNAACRRRSRSCGHIEIKMGNPGQPGYISDYKGNTAINETPASFTRRGPLYRLIGVMVRTDL